MECVPFSRVDATCVGAVSPHLCRVMTWARKPRSAKYGAAWTKTRAQWAALHDPAHLCTRCRHPLGPMNSGLHLDHDDVRPDLVRGFAHGAPCPWCRKRCNQSAGASKGARIANSRRRVTQLRW